MRVLAFLDDMEPVYQLRAEVLRPGAPPEESRYPSDRDPDTVHLGAFVGGRCVGVASFYRENGIRLRGMAVEPERQGQGIGAALIRHGEYLAVAQGQDLWCNARDSAIGFYERLGWVVEGQGFDFPGHGPHHVMRWRRPTMSHT
ncbi:MAG TPA: GNAT family N-acetyltransferase [Chloroflexia bacterium]|nr:GNAT family N-acetyltransferase [Chloroflexia bacterium]